MPQPKQNQQKQPQPQQQKPLQKHSSTSSTIIAKPEKERERTQTIGETDMDQSVLNGLAVGADGTAGFHGHKRELGHRWADRWKTRSVDSQNIAANPDSVSKEIGIIINWM